MLWLKKGAEETVRPNCQPYVTPTRRGKVGHNTEHSSLYYVRDSDDVQRNRVVNIFTGVDRWDVRVLSPIFRGKKLYYTTTDLNAVGVRCDSTSSFKTPPEFPWRNVVNRMGRRTRELYARLPPRRSESFVRTQIVKIERGSRIFIGFYRSIRHTCAYCSYMRKSQRLFGGLAAPP